jgi:hypothetical protein
LSDNYRSSAAFDNSINVLRSGALTGSANFEASLVNIETIQFAASSGHVTGPIQFSSDLSVTRMALKSDTRSRSEAFDVSSRFRGSDDFNASYGPGPTQFIDDSQRFSGSAILDGSHPFVGTLSTTADADPDRRVWNPGASTNSTTVIVTATVLGVVCLLLFGIAAAVALFQRQLSDSESSSEAQTEMTVAQDLDGSCFDDFEFERVYLNGPEYVNPVSSSGDSATFEFAFGDEREELPTNRLA